MPVFRDIRVHVTDAENRPLKEWGVSTRDRSGLTTCYIQSETDKPFRISITPVTFPFPAVEEELRAKKEERDRLDEVEVDEFGRDTAVRRLYRSPSPTLTEPPFHLVASLHLDGRETFEKRSFVYLNEDEDGAVMKCRTIRDENDNLRECGWVFKEIGIESVLENLDLGGDGVVPTTEEDDLVSDFQDLGAARLSDAEEQSTVGQIEITLERVKVGRKIDSTRPAILRDDGSGGVTGATAITTVTHTAGRDAGVQLPHELMRTRQYYPYEVGEEPYAKFRFYYRSEDVLRKFGFPGFPAKAAVEGVKTMKDRNDVLTKVAATALRSVRPSDEDVVKEVESMSLTRKRLGEESEAGAKKRKEEDE